MDYGRLPAGETTFVGYLTYGSELTVYASREDALNRTSRRCINGIPANEDIANAILLDGQLVEISGRIEPYPEFPDSMDAMLARVKNYCDLPNIFRSRSIRRVPEDSIRSKP